MRRVDELDSKGVRLATTTLHANELRRKLVDVFELNEIEAEDEAARIIGFFDLVSPEAFEHLQSEAEARLSQGGKSDWPALAAAMAFEGSIWSDDRDFFGVGVPVWASNNIGFVEAGIDR